MTRRPLVPAILASVAISAVLHSSVAFAGEAESEGSSEATITGVEAFDITPTSAAITWTVSEPATGQVEYGPTEEYGERSTLEDSFDYATHIQQLAGLEPDTEYHFRIISETEGGDRVTSGGHVFRTLPLLTFEPYVPAEVPEGYGPRPAPAAPEGALVVPEDIDATGGSDVGEELQAWVDAVAPGSVLVFPEGATYQLERGIYLDEGDQELTFHGYGATLLMTGCGEDQSESGFHIEDSQGIRILGFTIQGSNEAGATTAAYDAGCGESSMGVALYGDTRDIEVADTRISDVHGDAIYTNCSQANPDAGDYHFHHNLLERSGRQLITVNQGSDILIERNVLRAPALYSVDSEDCRTDEAVLRDLVVVENLFDTWNWHYSPDGEGPGEDFYACRAVANTYREDQIGQIEGILVQDNTFIGGCGGWGSPVAGLCDPGGATISMPNSATKSDVLVVDNVFDLPEEQRCGLAIELENVTEGLVSGNETPGMAVRCEGCSTSQDG